MRRWLQRVKAPLTKRQRLFILLVVAALIVLAIRGFWLPLVLWGAVWVGLLLSEFRGVRRKRTESDLGSFGRRRQKL